MLVHICPTLNNSPFCSSFLAIDTFSVDPLPLFYSEILTSLRVFLSTSLTDGETYSIEELTW